MPIGALVIAGIEQLARDQPALHPPLVGACEFRRIARRGEHELRRLVDMLRMALAVDPHVEQSGIVAQGRRGARGNLGPARVMGQIGLRAVQRHAVLARQRGRARGGRLLLAQHQPVGAIKVVGDGERAGKGFQQAFFQRGAEVVVAPEVAGDLVGLGGAGRIIAQPFGVNDLSGGRSRRKFREIGGDAVGLGPLGAGHLLRALAQQSGRPVRMGAHEGGDPPEPGFARMKPHESPFHGRANRRVLARQHGVAGRPLPFGIGLQGLGDPSEIIAERDRLRGARFLVLRGARGEFCRIGRAPLIVAVALLDGFRGANGRRPLCGGKTGGAR